MIVRIALLLISLLLLAHGADGLYRVIRSRTQTQMTCEEFARARPRSAWLRLTGCEVDYVNAGYREAPGDLWGRLFTDNDDARPQIGELVFPLRPAGAPAEQPAALVLSTRDPRVLAIAERTLGARAAIDQEAFLVMMLQVVTAMNVSREVEGTLRAPLDAFRSRRALSGIDAPLTDDYAVLDLRERPRVIFPALEASVGALALFIVLFRLRRAPAPEPAMPAPAVPVDFPRLMLVNLPPSASPADIEHAPPLGSHAAVRARIAKVLPGIEFDDQGKGRFEGDGSTVTVDLGHGDPVYAAVLHVRGDAAATLTQLLENTGWRAFAPRRGAFVTTLQP